MDKFPAKKICVIRTSALGDVVHAMALVEALRHGYPDAEITWVLQPLAYEMVKHQGAADHYVLFDRKGGRKHWQALRKRFKGEVYDVVLMLQVSIKASAISTLIKGRLKLGFDMARSRECQWLFSNRRIPKKTPGHVQDQFFEFAEYLGVTDYPVAWNFGFTDAEQEERVAFFDGLGAPAVTFVVASSSPDKDWPAARYAEAVDHVARKGLVPVLTGGPSPREKALADEISRLAETKPVIALQNGIRDLLVVLSGSTVVVSPDTGPLHMAVALNVPTVSLFGYSNPRRCGPYRRFPELLIDRFTESAEENGARRYFKTGRMEYISVSDVTEKIDLALERYAGPPTDRP
ncbi:glycosyltransferase family 9 protein [Desulfoluna butyratoxydans]|uniref:Glycosyl transferase family 9 n=1 Tax=Desulfoluna butyratoxydans TaxID=231438 RepID=A0A4U8YM31_9BACT|nr:glycosyltransferase family 9 protein [Desulfoluna butyratoxydans]VFQ42602.1 glycosyl transferase family 9 [Desulfoluna butyratoxydans]